MTEDEKIICKNCGHELQVLHDLSEYHGRYVLKHKNEYTESHDEVGGYDSYHCSVIIVDCDKCKREHRCGCMNPEPKRSKHGKTHDAF